MAQKPRTILNPHIKKQAKKPVTYIIKYKNKIVSTHTCYHDKDKEAINDYLNTYSILESARKYFSIYKAGKIPRSTITLEY